MSIPAVTAPQYCRPVLLTQQTLRPCSARAGQTARHASTAINPAAIEIVNKARKGWTDTGGELISLPPEEQAAMMKTLSGVGAEVSKAKPALSEAYKIVTDAAERTR